jgi:hypothetical protein
MTAEQKANFEKWFRSSVVTEDGKAGSEPKVVYHGSPADIKAFSKKFLKAGNHENGIGYYFTDETTGASGYGEGGAVYPAYLRITKPIVYGKEKNITLAQVSKLCTGLGKKHFTQFLRDNYDVDYTGLQAARDEYFDAVVRNPLIQAAFSIYNDVYDGAENETNFAEVFKNATGYDGIIVPKGAQGQGTNYVVFSPKQIKSAVGNSGRFKNNDNIVE